VRASDAHIFGKRVEHTLEGTLQFLGVWRIGKAGGKGTRQGGKLNLGKRRKFVLVRGKERGGLCGVNWIAAA